MVTVRIDDNSSDDSQNGQTTEMTVGEVEERIAAGDEVVLGDPAAAAGEPTADFTIFNTAQGG